jgi:hypothetical protein
VHWRERRTRIYGEKNKLASLAFLFNAIKSHLL